MVIVAAGIVLIPNLPLIRITVWVEAFNAFVLPIVLGFLVVLSNDNKILGDRVNSPLGNVVAIGVAVVCVGLGLWMGTLDHPWPSRLAPRLYGALTHRKFTILAVSSDTPL